MSRCPNSAVFYIRNKIWLHNEIPEFANISEKSTMTGDAVEFGFPRILRFS